MKGKPPAFQLYARDWLAHTRLMTPVQIAYRIQLWASAWDSDRPGCLPEGYEPWRFAGAASEEEFLTNGGEVLLREFTRDSHGRMALIQLTAQRREQVARAKLQREKGIAAARKRWQQPAPGNTPAMPRPQPKNPSASASASAPALASLASSSNSPHFGKGSQVMDQEQTTTEPPEFLVQKLQDWHRGFDLEAIRRLWTECQARTSDCTAEEVVAMCNEKFMQKYDRKTERVEARNVIGYLLTSVPKAFEKAARKGGWRP